MPDFSQRSDEKELLDRDDIPFSDIRQNMRELETINTWLGGHRITVRGLKRLISPGPEKQPLTVCEIGCGGGDNLAAIKRWCVRYHRSVKLIGIDINPHCIQFATTSRNLPDTEWITSDYQTVTFVRKPDIIFCSLFCHHLPDGQLTNLVRWMHSNSRKGFFINDLHRHPLAFFLIQKLTKWFSKSYLVKHDAPLSVARSFRKADWKKIFHQAGIPTYSIQWQWAFRWLVISRNLQADGTTI